MSRTDAATAGVDITVPHPARMYDYWRGGKDNYAADRRAADAIAAELPDVAIVAQAHHRFVQRAVRHQVVELGIRQFVVIGCGIPTGASTHTTAQALDPRTRVVYADPDPIVAVHSRALLVSHPRGVVEFVDGGIDDVSALLDDPLLSRVVDLREPVSFRVASALWRLSDEGAAAVLDVLKDVMAPGSCLVASHGTTDFDPEATRRAAEAGAANGVPQGTRGRDGFAEFFTGLDLVDPGVVPIVSWHPDEDETVRDPHTVSIYGGIGRKP